MPLSRDVQTVFQRAENCISNNDITSAIQLYEECLDIAERHSKPSILIKRAHALLLLQQWGGALEDARAIIQLQPTWGKGYHLLATVYLGKHRAAVEKGRFADLCKASKSLNMAAMLDPNNQSYRQLKQKVKDEMTCALSKKEVERVQEESLQFFPKQLLALSGVDPSGRMVREKTPVTLITGFLGVGKTTLVQHLLSESNGKKIAVFVNDMGALNIDAELLETSTADQEVIPLTNGCICCTLRGDLFTNVLDVATGKDKIDHIVVESSGVSELIPIVQTFLMKDQNARSLSNIVQLHCLIGVVDALTLFSLARKHSPEQAASIRKLLPNPDMSALVVDQIEYANVIVVNKVDLVPASDFNVFERECRGFITEINPAAEVLFASYSQLSCNILAQQGRFDPTMLVNSKKWEEEFTTSHLPETEAYGIQSFAYETPLLFQKDAFEGIFRGNANNVSTALVTKYGLIRAKGQVYFYGEPNPYQFAVSTGTCTLHQQQESCQSPSTAENHTHIVFIGVQLKQQQLREVLESCLIRALETRPDSLARKKISLPFNRG